MLKRASAFAARRGLDNRKKHAVAESLFPGHVVRQMEFLGRKLCHGFAVLRLNFIDVVDMHFIRSNDQNSA
jgi:hypothetical protein